MSWLYEQSDNSTDETQSSSGLPKEFTIEQIRPRIHLPSPEMHELSEHSNDLIPSLIADYQGNEEGILKGKDMVELLEGLGPMLDARFSHNLGEASNWAFDVRRSHNLLADVVGVLISRIQRLEACIEEAQNFPSLAREMRDCGKKFFPLDLSDPGSPERASTPILEAEVNVMDFSEPINNWGSLPKFSGTGETPFSHWVTKLEDFFDLEKPALTDPQKIARMKILLDGNARAFFNDLLSDPNWPDADKKKYTKIKDELANKFTAKAAKSLANQKLSVASQSANESATQFANRIRQLVETATYGEELAVKKHRLLNEFVRGLKPAIRIMVKKEEPADFDSAIDWAQRLEALLEEESRLKEAAAISVNTVGSGPADGDALRKEFTLIKQQLGNLAQQVNSAQRNVPRLSQGPLYSAGDGKTPDGRTICGYCKKIGHSIVTCWARDAGLAPWNRNKGNSSGNYKGGNSFEVNMMDLTGAVSGWNSVTQFSGSGEIPFDQWLVRLEDLFDLQTTELDAKQKAGRLKFYLTGNARAFFDQLDQGVREDYAQAVPRLKAKFVARAAKSLANQKLYTACQHHDEKVANFANKIRHLVNTATIGEDAAVAKHRMLNEFIRGLKPSVRMLVKKEDPGDFDSALELAIRFEGLLDEEAALDRTGTVNAVHTPANSGVTYQDLQWMRKQIAALADQLNGQRMGTEQPVNDNRNYAEFRKPASAQSGQVTQGSPPPPRQCYRCGNMGHIARNCRNPPMNRERRVSFASGSNNEPVQGQRMMSPPPKSNGSSGNEQQNQTIFRKETQELGRSPATNPNEAVESFNWLGRPGTTKNQAEVAAFEVPSVTMSSPESDQREVSFLDREISGVRIVPKSESPELDPILPLPGSTAVVLGKLNGKYTPLLLDSGAAVTIASIEKAPSLGIDKVYCEQVEVIGVAGQSLQVIGSHPMTIQLGNTEVQTRMYFTRTKPTRSNLYDVIVGCDTMRLFPPIVMDLAKCKITIGQDILWVGDPVTSFPVRAPLKVFDTIALEPESESRVKAYMGPIPLSFCPPYVTGDPSSKLARKCLGLTPGVFTPDHAGVVECWVINPTRERVVLYENMEICEATLVSVSEGHLAEFDSGLELRPNEDLDEADPTFKVDLSKVDVEDGDKDKLIQLLEEFDDVFAKSKYDLGSCKLVCPTITTTTETPIRSRPSRTPAQYRKELRDHIDKLLKSGTMVPSDTPWVSSIVLVQKKDGSLRPCIDFRKLNAITIPDHYPLARFDTILERIGNSTYFSSLDMANGYMQLPLDQESSYKCGVTTEEGVFRMTHLPFGLRNAASVFTRIMSKVLEGLEDEVLAYIDDVLIFTRCKTFEAHLRALRAVFQRMRDFNLKLSPKKCFLARRKVDFYGHIISGEGYTPACQGIEKIKNFPVPKNLRQVRSFVGLVNFFRKFIPDCSKHAEPLTRLTKKDNRFYWGDEQQESFDKLIEIVSSEPILGYPDYDREFHIFADASSVAQAGVLMQYDEERKAYKAIAYCSRVMNERERLQAPVHAELGALIYCLRSFRPYIFNSKIIIHSDHRPLSYLLNNRSDPHKQLARWVMELQQYDIKIVHVAGNKNTVADALSRAEYTDGSEGKTLDEMEDLMDFPICLPIEASELNLVDQIECYHFEGTAKDQEEDEVLRPIRSYLSNGTVPEGLDESEISRFKRGAERFSLGDDGCLYLKYGEKQLGKNGLPPLVIPRTLQKSVFEFFHKSHLGGCHLGFKKSLNKARRYYWDGMAADFKRWSDECQVCQMRRNPRPRFRNPMTIVRNSHVFHKIGIDLSGPYKCTERENRYVMNVICWYSKFLISVPIQNLRAVTVARALLENCVLRYGTCVELVSDNGSCFTSECFREFCSLLGIEKVYSTPYHSQGNAATERTFKVVQDILAKTISANQDDWDLMLPFASFSYNVSIHESTKETPFFLNHARDPLFAIDLALDPRTKVPGNPDSEVEGFRKELILSLRYAGQLVREEAAKASARQKERYDRGVREQDLVVGDRVFLKNFATKPGLSRKLDLPWKGLHRIVGLTDTHAEIVRIGQGDQSPRKVNREQIKKWLGFVAEDQLSHGRSIEASEDDGEINPATAIPQDMGLVGDNSDTEEFLPKPQVTRSGRLARPPVRYQ